MKRMSKAAVDLAASLLLMTSYLQQAVLCWLAHYLHIPVLFVGGFASYLVRL
eukprot:c29686_g1_i1 orf=53-208(+)